MRKFFFLLAVIIVAAVAATSRSESASIEAVRGANDAALQEAAASLPIALKGKAAALRCDARLAWNRSGYHGRCPYGRVVTGVQLTGDLAILSCAKVEVTCR